MELDYIYWSIKSYHHFGWSIKSYCHFGWQDLLKASIVYPIAPLPGRDLTQMSIYAHLKIPTRLLRTALIMIYSN